MRLVQTAQTLGQISAKYPTCNPGKDAGISASTDVEKGSVVHVGNNPSTDAGTDAGTYVGEGMGSGIDREASRDAGGDISIREHTLAEAVYSVATALITGDH